MVTTRYQLRTGIAAHKNKSESVGNELSNKTKRSAETQLKEEAQKPKITTINKTKTTSKRSFHQIDGHTPTQPLKIERVEREDSVYQIDSLLCKDIWRNVIEFCDTRQWLSLSYTCKGINQSKFNRSLMSNKKRTLKVTLKSDEIGHYFRLAQGTLFNVDLNQGVDTNVTDEHFQFLEGIHTLHMSHCEKITDKAFAHLKGIHTLNMSFCDQHTITDKAFVHLTGIHTLNISCCKNITDDAFIHLKGIHTLDMRCCEELTGNALSHLTGIHTLNMSGCSNITDEAFIHLKGIQTLKMSYCEQITDKAFAHLKGIHTLNMTGCTQITDSAFEHLTGVVHLIMDECTQDSLKTEKLLRCLENVRSLSWSDTTMIGFKPKLKRFVEANSIELYLD